MKVTLCLRTGIPRYRLGSHERTDFNRGLIPELVYMHEKTITVDTELSWETELESNFGIQIDCRKYYARRVQTKNGNGEPAHSLKEPISNLMSEFTTRFMKKVYCIQIMAFDEKVTLSSVNKTLKQGLTSSSTSTSTSSSTSSLWERKLSRKYNEKTTKSSGRKRLASKQVGNEIHYHHLNKRAKVILTPVSPKRQQNNHRNNIPIINQTQWNEKKEAKKKEKVGEMSPDEFKTWFFNRAKNTVTNSQLLQARHALQEMKSSNNNKWSKWSLSVPISTSILRTLLDF